MTPVEQVEGFVRFVRVAEVMLFAPSVSEDAKNWLRGYMMVMDDLEARAEMWAALRRDEPTHGEVMDYMAEHGDLIELSDEDREYITEKASMLLRQGMN